MIEAADAYFEEHKESADIGRRALRGGTVSVAMQYGNGVLQIVSSVVLARLLAPEDFGLVAIVTVLTSFAPGLIDFGLGDATTQRSKITRSQVSSLFWITLGIGSTIAFLVAASSPIIAAVYREPRLEAIALISSTNFVLWGLSNQHLALLRRTMQFGRVAKIQLFGTLAGTAISIIVAVLGYGYWALVSRSIVTALWVTLGSWIVCGWRPGSPAFDNEVKSMVRFGLSVAAWAMTSNISRSADRIGLGLFYRPDEVGFYHNATNLYEWSIFGTLLQLHTVGSAALSKLQFSPAALREKYEAALSALAFFVMPAAAILSVTAVDVTVLLLGEKWQPTGSLLGIIALRGIFQVIETSGGWLHLAIGRSDRWRNAGVVTAAVQIMMTVGGLPFGTEGVALAAVMTSVMVALPSALYAGRPIGIGVKSVIRAVGPQLVAAICTAAGGWWLHTTLIADFPIFARISLSIAFCIFIYAVITLGVFRVNEPMKVAISIIRDLVKNR